MTTLGLTYPWAVASLERYKMRHTFYGDVGGKFVGAGWRLFLRGIPIWIIIVGPIVGGAVVAATTLDRPAIAHALARAQQFSARCSRPKTSTWARA
jgi:uncharacterized membrane protein YjgN (DUF898 family)